MIARPSEDAPALGHSEDTHDELSCSFLVPRSSRLGDRRPSACPSPMAPGPSPE